MIDKLKSIVSIQGLIMVLVVAFMVGFLVVFGLRSCTLGARIPFMDADQIQQEDKLPELFK